MAEPTELILFVPGMGAREPGEYLDKLISGIEGYCADRGHTLESVADADPEHEGRRQVAVTTASGERRQYELRELFWTDLRRNLSEEPAGRKALLGLDLLLFWVSSSKVWQAARNSKYMLFGTLFTLCILLAWYYGVVAIALAAFGADPAALGAPPDAAWAKTLKDWSEAMGGWKPWATATALMTLLPASAIVNVSYSTKRYLQNRDRFQQRATARLKREIIGAATKAEPGRRTLLAHSFGVVVATEALATLPADYAKELRFMSLGGPLELIQARSARVEAAVQQLTQWLSEGVLQQWTDFYSNADWLCTAAPVEAHHFVSRELTSTVAWTERANGASHSLYFADYAVIEELLGI